MVNHGNSGSVNPEPSQNGFPMDGLHWWCVLGGRIIPKVCEGADFLVNLAFRSTFCSCREGLLKIVVMSV
jgi:hypothetical protein